MNRAVLFFLALCASLFVVSAQDLKPCGTSVLQKRHKRSGSVWTTRAAQKKAPSYQGERRGLIILVSFPNQPFSTENPRETWNDIANKAGYTPEDLRWTTPGSVADYFRDQSYGQFRLTFDVVGPVEAAHEYAYYGDNKDWGDPTGWFDQNVGELVAEACRGVADTVRFADYDWDDDGEVEEVYILYAGHGENDYSRVDSTVIWPHMASLSIDWEGYEHGLELQGMRIDTYACSNEIASNGSLAGVGTFCHEFSHCLGLPDLYDTESGYSVLGRYDLMDMGNYNGNSWCPVGYSSYERYACGWLEPRAVTSLEEVGELQPLHEVPDACIFRTSAEANDYYLVENRQKTSWDAYIPTAGLLAWHVDYDAEVWASNEVNNDPDHLRVEWMKPAETPIPVGITPLRVDRLLPARVYDLLGGKILIRRNADGTTKKYLR